MIRPDSVSTAQSTPDSVGSSSGSAAHPNDLAVGASPMILVSHVQAVLASSSVTSVVTSIQNVPGIAPSAQKLTNQAVLSSSTAFAPAVPVSNSISDQTGAGVLRNIQIPAVVTSQSLLPTVHG